MAKLKNRAVAEQRVRDYIVDSMYKSVDAGVQTLAEAVTMQEQAADDMFPGTDWAYLYDYRKCKTLEDRLVVAVGQRVERMHIDALSQLNSQLKLFKRG